MKKFSIFYVILSIVKFFTARVDLQTEESPLIILKLYPSIKNIFLGGDVEIAYYKKTYTWFKQQLYITLISTNDYFFGVKIYDIVIVAWWIISGCLLIYILINFCNNK